MLDLEPNKVFMIQIHAPGLETPVSELATGKNVGNAILDIKDRYPNFKRIVIYDADTKDAIRIIKNNQ